MKSNRLMSMVLAAVLLSGGCAGDFLPPSYLDGPRILALVADPLEAGPADEVTVTPHLYLPQGDSLSAQRWTFCPFSLGPAAGYRCALPACETELDPQEDGSVRAGVGALAWQCAAELVAGGGGGGIPAEIPEKVEVYFRYRADASSGQTLEAVLRQVLWTRGVPPAPNGPPLFESLQVEGRALARGDSAGAVAAGGRAQVRVRIDPDSLDPFIDAAGRSRTEEALISFYASAGRFEFDRIVATDATVTWKAEKLEPGQVRTEIYAVARDLRGGQAVFGPVFVPLLR